MSTLEFIKNGIKRLYENSPDIHISVNMTNPRLAINGKSVRLIGVYKNIFQVEEFDSSGHPSRRSFQYGAVMTGHVVIDELDYAPTVSILNNK